VVSAKVIEIDRDLYKLETEEPSIEMYIALRIACNRGDMVNS